MRKSHKNSTKFETKTKTRPCMRAAAGGDGGDGDAPGDEMVMVLKLMPDALERLKSGRDLGSLGSGEQCCETTDVLGEHDC